MTDPRRRARSPAKNGHPTSPSSGRWWSGQVRGVADGRKGNGGHEGLAGQVRSGKERERVVAVDALALFAGDRGRVRTRRARNHRRRGRGSRGAEEHLRGSATVSRLGKALSAWRDSARSRTTSETAIRFLRLALRGSRRPTQRGFRSRAREHDPVARYRHEPPGGRRSSGSGRTSPNTGEMRLIADRVVCRAGSRRQAEAAERALVAEEVRRLVDVSGPVAHRVRQPDGRFGQLALDVPRSGCQLRRGAHDQGCVGCPAPSGAGQRPRMPRATLGDGPSRVQPRSFPGAKVAPSTGDWARASRRTGWTRDPRPMSPSPGDRQPPRFRLRRTADHPTACPMCSSEIPAKDAHAGPAATNDRPGRWHRRQPQRTDLSGRRPARQGSGRAAASPDDERSTLVARDRRRSQPVPDLLPAMCRSCETSWSTLCCRRRGPPQPCGQCSPTCDRMRSLAAVRPSRLRRGGCFEFEGGICFQCEAHTSPTERLATRMSTQTFHGHRKTIRRDTDLAALTSRWIPDEMASVELTRAETARLGPSMSRLRAG